MKTLLLSLFISCSIVPSVTLAQTKSVRIAHHFFQNLNDIDGAYLDYMARSGYTHVLAHGDMFSSSFQGEWNNGAYIGSATADGLRKRFTDLFSRARARGIGIIPCFNMSSRWAGHWSFTGNLTFNPGNPPHEFGNLISEDALGIQKSFRSYLSIVKAAYAAAGYSTQLDYIHIGHDENYNGAGGFWLPGSSANQDRTVLNTYFSQGAATPAAHEQAHLRLMAEEIVRRVNDVKSVFTSGVPGIMIWADHLDPQFYNNLDGSGTLSAYTTLSGGTIPLATSKVVSRSELAGVKANLIPVFWRSSLEWRTGRDGIRPYAPSVSIAHLVNAGFNRIILGVAYETWTPGELPKGRQMLNAWAAEGQGGTYRSKILGYCSHTWTENNGNPPVRWSTHPTDPRFQAWLDFAERTGFYRTRNDLIQLWNLSGRLYAETYRSDGTRLVRYDGGYDLGPATATRYLMGDINNDKLTDVFALRDNGGRLAIQTFATSGTRFVPLGENTNAGGFTMIDFLAGDIDGDFSTDLFHLWDNNGALYVETYRFDAEGTRLFQPLSGGYNLGTQNMTGFQAGDFTGDGRSDLVGYRASQGYRKFKPMYSDGIRFRAMNEVSLYVGDGSLQDSWRLGDVEGNGRADIISAVHQAGSTIFHVLSGSGSGFSPLSSSARSSYGGEGPGTFLAADFTGDGRTDLARLVNISGYLRVDLWASNGSTLVFTSTTTGLGPFLGEYRVADINRDRRADLIRLRSIGGRLTVESYRSTGTAFASLSTSSDIGGYTALQWLVGDVDGNLAQ